MSQVIKKTTIVIASVLKPVDDTRMFEKIGQQLALSGEYDVHLIGFPSRGKVNFSGISFYPLRHFARMSIERLVAPWEILRLVMRIKPTILIITTHELLTIGLIAKWQIKCKLIYDVQENYYRNIRFTSAFPISVRPALSSYVRHKEKLCSRFVDTFFLAEKSYAQELDFLRAPITLPNKFKFPAILPPVVKKGKTDNCIHLLFSGTLAETTGAFEAIALARSLHKIDSSIRLTLIGYCAVPSMLAKIRQLAATHSFITIKGGDQLVPHNEIVVEILRSDFGIIAYPPNRSTQGSVPTKLYEYLGLKLPILMPAKQPGSAIALECDAAIVYTQPVDADEILAAVKSKKFYKSEPEDVYWEPEGEKMLQRLKQLLTQ